MSNQAMSLNSLLNFLLDELTADVIELLPVDTERKPDLVVLCDDIAELFDLIRVKIMMKFDPVSRFQEWDQRRITLNHNMEKYLPTFLKFGGNCENGFADNSGRV